MQGVCRANIAHLSRPIAHEVLGVLDLTSRHIMPRLDELSASQIAHVAKAIATMVEMDDVASRMTEPPPERTAAFGRLAAREGLG